MKSNLLDIVSVGNTLGEGVLWDDVQKVVWWTDIQSNKLFCYNPCDKSLKTYSTPTRLCSFGFTEKAGWLITAFDDGLAYYNPQSGEVNYVCKPFNGTKGIRFNDGRIGPDGKFWVGTMIEKKCPETLALSGLYSLSPDGTVDHYLSGVEISNAICWSNDGKRMYFADSPKQIIWSFDFANNSTPLTNQMTYVHTHKNSYPDGAVVDSENLLWNAQWGGSRVACYNPEGEEVFALNIPASQPTCVAFGSSDNHYLFVTSARENLDEKSLAEQPHAGDLFIFETDVVGICPKIFKRN